MSLPQIFFSSYFGNAIATNQLPPFFFPSILAMPFHKSIATFFFSFYLVSAIATNQPQFFSKKKFLPKISATWLPHFFFPPIFSNLVATIHIFSLLHSLQFRQLGCHNWFPFRALPLACILGTSWAGQEFWYSHYRNSIFSPSPSHHLSFFSLILFLTILTTVSFLIFPNNFERYL